MENVKFLKFEKACWYDEYFFKVSKGIAEYICSMSDYDPISLRRYLTENDEFIFRIGSLFGKPIPKLSEEVINNIERISNELNETEFCNQLITENGYLPSPSDFHNKMKYTYKLKDEKLEWYVAHFFISFSGMLVDDEGLDEEDE